MVITYFTLLVTFDDIFYCTPSNVDTIVGKFSNDSMDWPSQTKKRDDFQIVVMFKFKFSKSNFWDVDSRVNLNFMKLRI
jgi:hypothetical protein